MMRSKNTGGRWQTFVIQHVCAHSGEQVVGLVVEEHFSKVGIVPDAGDEDASDMDRKLVVTLYHIRYRSRTTTAQHAQNYSSNKTAKISQGPAAARCCSV